MMISINTLLESGASRSVHGHSSSARTKRAVTLLVLPAALILVGAPAEAAAPTSTSNQMSSTVDPPPPCRGEKPGLCPDTPFVQPNQPAGVGLYR
jgi:hypothetical protein